MKHTAIILLLLMGIAAYANSNNEEAYLARLDAAGIHYVYSDEGRLTILSTKATDKAIFDLAKAAPDTLDVEVVPYVFEEEE